MNPQMTTIGTDQIDQFVVADDSAVEREWFELREAAPTVILEPTVDIAERTRQDSLDFLHKLVMG